MKNYIIYNEEGKILRTGTCMDISFEIKASIGEFIIEGEANDITQKIINEEIVNKTIAEIEAEKVVPEVVPYDQQPAKITKGQLDDIINRLNNLEGN